MADYNKIERFLHYIIFENPSFRRLSFFLENKLFKNKINQFNIRKNKHVFVIGMPRYGTTVLLNFLYQTNNFASLTYLDMPFILSPNLWSLFTIKNNSVSKERIHNDGIKQSVFSQKLLRRFLGYIR